MVTTSVYLIGGLIIGLGALLAKHFCTTGSVDPEILFTNRNIFAWCRFNDNRTEENVVKNKKKQRPSSFMLQEKVS